MLQVDPDHRPTAEQIYNKTTKLGANQKPVAPRIEFKFTQDITPNVQFSDLLKDKNAEEDTALENFAIQQDQGEKELEYNLCKQSEAQDKPNAQIAQGAPTDTKYRAQTPTSNIDAKVAKAIELLVEDTSEGCWKMKVQRSLINLISEDGSSRADKAVAIELNRVK